MPGKREINWELLRLKDLIEKHFTQSDWKSLGLLTNQFELVDNHPRLLRSMGFGDDDYEGHVLSVLSEMVEADSDNLALIQQFMARKYPEAGEYVSSAASPARKIVFTPSVFSVPDEPVDTSLVSIMMPFAGFDPVHDAIKGAVADAGLKCERADNVWEHSVVVQDIFSLVFRSFIVVCDFSGRNPNVMYEAGIAHTLGKHVVPITQSKDDIPFDLQHHRYLSYLNNAEGRGKLRAGLTDRLKTLVRHGIPAPI
jgi:hypothetical protein